MTSAHGRRPGRAERDVPAANIHEPWRGVGKFASPVRGACHGPSPRHRKVLQTSPDEAERNGPKPLEKGHYPCSAPDVRVGTFLASTAPAIEWCALRRGRVLHGTSRR